MASLFAYVGCYTSPERGGRGKGINVYRVDRRTGAFAHVQLLPIENPSFLAFSGDGRHLYAIHGDRSEATSFTVDPRSGELTLLNRQPTGGYNPIHLALDATSRFLVVANYGSDSTAVLPIHPDGSLGAYSTLFTWGEDAKGVHRGIDGMCLDADGNIVATNGWEVSGPGAMITVFSPTGRVLETHPVPADRPTNCCFGGRDLTTLFVTTTQGHFFKAETDRVGWAMYP